MKKVETRGRKPKDTVVRESKITLKMSAEQLKRVEKIAEYLEIPKTVIARNMLLSGLESAETMKITGVLSIAKGIIKTSEWLAKTKEQRTST